MTGPRGPDSGALWRTRGARLLWLALAIPALVQVALLLYTVLSRIGYPYDLEWMEGGLLGHAARIASGHGIYVAPSVNFIPYLYTPLYPALVALLGGMFGISYLLGRLISVLAMLGTIGLLVAAVVRRPGSASDPAEAVGGSSGRRAAWAGAAFAAGLYAATYPWVEGWYDLVRADTLFVLMAVGGLHAIHVWARVPGTPGRVRVGVAAGILALSFFCKQTGVFYVAGGGAALLALNWRRVPLFLGITGAIGLGGTWLFNRASGGWFWTYVYQVHQAHDFNHHRFWASYGHILGHFPLMSVAIGVGIVAIAVAAVVHRRRPPGSSALRYWAPMFALSCVVGAVGWGTQWAHFNAYIPAMTTGALAAGAAIPALVGAVSTWPARARLAPTLGLVLAAALSVQLGATRWRPARFIPTARDRRAGDALIAQLRTIQGDVFMPYHPWYPVMAGKPLYVHRMGLLDLTYHDKWRVAGLRQAFLQHRFAAVVLDDRPVGPELGGLRRAYRMDDFLPDTMAPHVYTGALVHPQSIWVPAEPLPVPPGASVLFDFESGKLTGWKTTGPAWGRHPAAGPIGNQGPVRRYGGRYYASSYHGGDHAVGTLTSPEFAITGSRITFRLSGGRNDKTLRAELWIDGVREKVVTGNQSERMEDQMWNVASYDGHTGTIVLVDRERGSWGHLNVDEIWQWR